MYTLTDIQLNYIVLARSISQGSLFMKTYKVALLVAGAACLFAISMAVSIRGIVIYTSAYNYHQGLLREVYWMSAKYPYGWQTDEAESRRFALRGAVDDMVCFFVPSFLSGEKGSHYECTSRRLMVAGAAAIKQNAQKIRETAERTR